MPTKEELKAQNAQLRRRVEQLERLLSTHDLTLLAGQSPPSGDVFTPLDKQPSAGTVAEAKFELPSSQWALIAWLINKCPKWLRVPLLAIFLLAIGGTIAYLVLPDTVKKSLIPSLFEQKQTQAKDLKELYQDSLTVLYERNTVDLSWWVPTPSNLLGNRAVPEKRILIFKVIKRSDQANYFTTDVYTSSNPSPDFVCFTHPWEFRDVEYTPEVGAPALKKYQALIDVSKAPLDSEFEIKAQYIVWNPNRGLTQSWVEIGIYHETASAELEVKFPQNKLPLEDSLQCSYSPLYRPSLDVIDKQRAKIQLSSDRIIWSLSKDDIKIRHRYRMQWQW
jgi:hypothetical protein